MSTLGNNHDCESVCINHETNECLSAIENINERIVNPQSKGRSKVLNICKHSSLKRRRTASRCSCPCLWAICTTVLCLAVTVVGVVTFVQLSSEMEELKEQFMVSFEELTRDRAREPVASLFLC